MALEREQKKRRYVFSSAELKEALGIEGTIKRIGIWAGQSTHQKEAGESPDNESWSIETDDGDFN